MRTADVTCCINLFQFASRSVMKKKAKEVGFVWTLLLFIPTFFSIVRYVSREYLYVCRLIIS